MNLLESINNSIKENFELQSADYNSDNHACFAVLQNNSNIGVVRFELLDGTPVNVYDDKTNPKMTKPIIDIKVSDLIKFKDWVMLELVRMGFKYNPIIINNNEYEIDKTDVDLEVESLKIFLKMEK